MVRLLDLHEAIEERRRVLYKLDSLQNDASFPCKSFLQNAELSYIFRPFEGIHYYS